MAMLRHSCSNRFNRSANSRQQTSGLVAAGDWKEAMTEFEFKGGTGPGVVLGEALLAGGRAETRRQDPLFCQINQFRLLAQISFNCEKRLGRAGNWNRMRISRFRLGS